MLTQEEKENILSDFPNIKLSYETIVHKKVYNYDYILGIPEGKKCFAWFTSFNDKYSCFILELDNKSKKEIKNIKVMNSCFSTPLCYGTLFFGTLFYHMNNPFFSIEDIYLYKGKDISNYDFPFKLNKISFILKNEIKQISYNNYFLVFGLPIIAKTNDEFEKKISKINYKLYSIQYIKNKSSHTLSYDEYKNEKNISIKQPVQKIEKSSKYETKNNLLKQGKIFTCKPDVQNDIYHLYSQDNEYIGLACIPDYKTSIMMNKLFRIIKENNDLDALEESDDEEEFENPNVDKFVHLDKSFNMICNFNNKFKKWVPIKITNYIDQKEK
jgi:hypothetical protein